MQKYALSLVLVIVLVLVLAAPAFAQMSHTAAYELDGTIDFEKQAGHKCNTGAAIMQTIVGNGVMDKIQTVSMIEGRIMMEDDNNWVAGATPLTVTTVWDLCLPPKQIIELKDGDSVVPLQLLYPSFPYFGFPFPPDSNGFPPPPNGDVLIFPKKREFTALTDQIWAVQVQADPGFSGNLYQNGVAAHGEYAHPHAHVRRIAAAISIPIPIGFFGFGFPYGFDGWEQYNIADKWTWVLDANGVPVPTPGPDYVGNYFDMEQHARTSQGTLRRYISISSPFNHSYLMEDMSVVGKSDVQETFALMNIKPGADMPGNWWVLF